LPTPCERTWDVATPGRCLIVGEVAQAHDGSLGMAHAFVDAIANAGADVVKFQTHIAAAESTEHEPWRVKFSRQDERRCDYWRRMEFTEGQWRGLMRHAAERGLLFLTSPFSSEAVDMLRRIGASAWKVASGELSNDQLLTQLLETALPAFVSTGMDDLAAIDRVVPRWRARSVPLALLQCTSAYPCPPDRVGLNVIPLFRGRYGCPVGLSDHSGTIFPALAAATIGAAIIEVHVTLSREMFGPDVCASVTTGELRTLVDGVRFIEAMTAHPVDKDAAAVAMRPMRTIFSKSIVPRTDLSAGIVLTSEHLALKKPGTGMPPARLPELIGRRLARDLRANELLRDEDLERPADV
jgi:N,N'-diacetyllegionaminate synthase